MQVSLIDKFLNFDKLSILFYNNVKIVKKLFLFRKPEEIIMQLTKKPKISGIDNWNVRIIRREKIFFRIMHATSID